MGGNSRSFAALSCEHGDSSIRASSKVHLDERGCAGVWRTERPKRPTLGQCVVGRQRHQRPERMSAVGPLESWRNASRELLMPDPQASTSSPMVVLVHGAWHGSWCWAKVVPLL